MTMHLLAAVLVFACQGSDAKQRYAQKVADMNDYFWKERIKIAEWAKGAGLYREARSLLEFMVKNIDGRHPYKSRADNLLTGSWKKKANTATEAKQKDYAKKLEAYYRGVADRCWDAYKIAKGGGMAEEAKLCFAKTVEFYHDHDAARKERGEVKVEGFGWVSAADAKLPVLDRADESEDAAHSTWATAWVLRSKHYLLRTDLPAKRATAVLELLEKLYETLRTWCEGTFAEPPGPMGIYFFRNGRDLEMEKAKLPNPPNAIAFFHGMTNIVYLRSFDSAREQGDGVGRSDMEFLLHEATHQYLDMGSEQRVFSIFQQSNQRADALDNYWIVEGIANVFATPEKDWRTELAKSLLQQGKMPALRLFILKNYEEFLANPYENYTIATVVARFLMDKNKKKFLEFLKEYYLGNGSVESFEKILGNPDPMDKELRAWLESR